MPRCPKPAIKRAPLALWVVCSSVAGASLTFGSRVEAQPLHVHAHSRRLASPFGVTPWTADARPYHDLVRRAEALYGVSADLIHAIITVESAYNPKAVSSAGAKGLMQLMPLTAKSCGVRNAFDPAQNIFGGAVYLTRLARLFRGDLVLILAAYHAGPTSVWDHSGVPTSLRTRAYVRSVLREYATQLSHRQRAAELRRHAPSDQTLASRPTSRPE